SEYARRTSSSRDVADAGGGGIAGDGDAAGLVGKGFPRRHIGADTGAGGARQKPRSQGLSDGGPTRGRAKRHRGGAAYPLRPAAGEAVRYGDWGSHRQLTGLSPRIALSAGSPRP